MIKIRKTMKQFIYLSLLLMMLSNCKESEDTPPMSLATQTVSGKWLLKETEQIVNGKLVWQPSNALSPGYIIFRSDGVIMNEEGKVSCCAPKLLNINNKQFEIKPDKAFEYAEDCSQIFCGSCPVWDIELKGDEMIISPCQVPRNKYVRQ
jgi:hypothetical protein